MPDPLAIACAYCHVAPGEPCHTWVGVKREPHFDRQSRGISLSTRTGWILRQQHDRDAAKAGIFGLGPNDEGDE